MSELYEVLNESYTNFLDSLCMSFEDIPGLLAERHVVSRMCAKHGPHTERIYQHLKGGLTLIVSAVHAKKEKIMVRANNKERIDLLECTHAYDIFPRMRPDEQEQLWLGYQKLIQILCFINGTGNQLQQFHEMARSVVAKNPGIAQNQIQAEVYNQMFAGGDISQKIVEVFQSDGIADVGSGMSQILRGLNLVKSKDEDDDDNTAQERKQEPEEDENEEKGESGGSSSKDSSQEVGENSDVNSSSSSSSSSSVNDLFQKMASEDAAIHKAQKKKQKQNQNGGGIQRILDFVEKRKLTEAQLKEIKALSSTTLGCDDGDKKNEKQRQGMRSLFQLFTQGASMEAVTAQMQEMKKDLDSSSKEVLPAVVEDTSSSSSSSSSVTATTAQEKEQVVVEKEEDEGEFEMMTEALTKMQEFNQDCMESLTKVVAREEQE